MHDVSADEGPEALARRLLGSQRARRVGRVWGCPASPAGGPHSLVPSVGSGEVGWDSCPGEGGGEEGRRGDSAFRWPQPAGLSRGSRLARGAAELQTGCESPEEAELGSGGAEHVTHAGPEWLFLPSLESLETPPLSLSPHPASAGCAAERGGRPLAGGKWSPRLENSSRTSCGLSTGKRRGRGWGGTAGLILAA